MGGLETHITCLESKRHSGKVPFLGQERKQFLVGHKYNRCYTTINDWDTRTETIQMTHNRPQPHHSVYNQTNKHTDRLP